MCLCWLCWSEVLPAPGASRKRCETPCIMRCRCIASSVCACKRTFRVYPEGTTSAQTSQRVKGLAVMLYLLGCALWSDLLSVRSAWGVPVQESGLWCGARDGQAGAWAQARSSVCRRENTRRSGGDLTSVKCKGEWLPLGITVDTISGVALTIDGLPAQDIKALQD